MDNKKLSGIGEAILENVDKQYNAYYFKNPRTEYYRGKSNSYFKSSPTPFNLLNGIYNYIMSDPTYGIRAKIRQDNRKFNRMSDKGKSNFLKDIFL